MRLIILKTNEIETACEKQEEDCQGINCKTCQFNKIGIDIEYFRNNVYVSILDFLNKSNTNIYDKAEGLTNLFINILLKEESDQSEIGSKIFKKIIH